MTAGALTAVLFGATQARAQPEPPPAYPAPPMAVPAPPAQPVYPGYQPLAPPPYPPRPRQPLTPTRESRPAVIYGELMGKGLIYSVGFDYALKRWFALGASFSYVEMAAFISPYVNFYPVGGYRHALMIQAGLQIVHVNKPPKDDFIDDLLWKEEGTDVGGQVSIGWEFRSSFVFRLSLMAMFNREGVCPWPGFTFGGSF